MFYMNHVLMHMAVTAHTVQGCTPRDLAKPLRRSSTPGMTVLQPLHRYAPTALCITLQAFLAMLYGWSMV
jgi:hypothetical protein